MYKHLFTVVDDDGEKYAGYCDLKWYNKLRKD